MVDYIYLLETRLSPAQQRAIGTIRAVAGENDATLFLTGGAVRDLTGGGSIRDIDLTVQGEAPKLKTALELAGAVVSGDHGPAQKLFLTFPGGVRVEVASAMSVTYPKPGRPVYESATLADDLRSRDFTANAMAISLNEGSFGLLIDPLNGVADIENRELRLVSNYGFIEEPSRLIRAARLCSRLGWHMEERTRQRYESAKEEGYISALDAWHRGYELEEIFHEDDPVRVLRALDSEGWMQTLSPALSSSKANQAALQDLAERQGLLQTQGILAHSAALAFPLVTAKLSAGDVAALKQSFVRPGFVREIDQLDARTREFGTRFASKEAALPSLAWKMLHAAEPDLVLSLSHGSKVSAVQSRLKTFLSDSPAARQKIPYTLLQEMRITPDLSDYEPLIDKLFFELMDGNLSTPEEMKAFLEPYSPPAPPPLISLRRARAKKESRPSRAKGKKATEPESLPTTVTQEEEADSVAAGLVAPGTLTGPDRGPEPTAHVPLEGKVAPEPVVTKERSKKVDTPAPLAKAKPASLPAASKPEPTPVKVATKASPTRRPAAPPVAAGKTKAAAKPVKSAPPAKAQPAKKQPGKAPAPAAKKTVSVKKASTKSSSANKAGAAKRSTATPKSSAKKQLPVKKAAPAKDKSAVKKTPGKSAPAKSSAAKKVAGKKTAGRR